MGWCWVEACLLACLFLESSQHLTCPQVRHSRRWIQVSPIARHFWHPSPLGMTFGLDRCGCTARCAG